MSGAAEGWPVSYQVSSAPAGSRPCKGRAVTWLRAELRTGHEMLREVEGQDHNGRA